MTRKQQLLQMLTGTGIIYVRNRQSMCFRPWWRVAPWRWKKIVGEGYEIAQLLHHLPSWELEPEFTDNDIRLLNAAQRLFKRAEPRTSYFYGTFFPIVRQLFDLVPEAMKPGLEWDGPQLPKMTRKRQREANDFLFHAIEHNSNIDTLHKALVCGPDLNARDRLGRTALDLATQLGKTDYVQELSTAAAKAGSRSK